VIRRGTEKRKRKGKEVSKYTLKKKNELEIEQEVCCSSNEDVTSYREEVVPKGICELRTR